MDLSAFYAQFREETADNVRAIGDGLLQLERAPGDRPTLDAIFRAAHTVKGSSRLLGFGRVSDLAHAMESLLGAMRTGALVLTPAINDLLLQSNDALLALATAASEGKAAPLEPAALIAQLEQAATGQPIEPPAAPAGARSTAPPAPPIEPATPLSPPIPAPDVAAAAVKPAPIPEVAVKPAATTAPPAGGGAAAAPKARATVRVRVDRLDRLLAVAGELTVGQQADSLHVDQLSQIAALIGQQQQQIVALAGELGSLRVPPAQRQSVQRQVAELRAQSSALSHLLRVQQESYVRRSAVHAQLVDELEAEVFAARLVPVATVFASLPRAIRELARTLERQVELELAGEETEADRKVLDALGDPLLHMVRNAVDHGIEPPAERVAAGKPPVGKLRIAAIAEHGQIRIAVGDDGRGMDPAKLRAAAVRKGLLDEAGAAALNDAEALDLIFAPGFSLSPIITDVSGRGVGMDIVRARIIELGGQVLIDSAVGVGTTITLVLPISLMTSQVLLVEAGKQLWAVPSRSCRGVLRLRRDSIRRVEGQPLIKHEGRTLPVVTLGDLLELPADNSPQRRHALLIGTARPVAVLVDRLVDEREVVVKPLGPLLGGHSLAAGVAPLPDGSLAVVLSAQELADRTRRTRALPEPQRTGRRNRLLIADDSFTTRELLRSILQSAGYEVQSAVDGQDALDKLRADGRFDLVVTDVEMPRLDGFGLTASIRADAQLNGVPVIIVTSLHSDEHKRQGVVAGAQAYIVKSQFDQSNLLAAVRDLLGAAS